MLSIIISTLVFFVAAWYLNRYLDGISVPKQFSRSILVFVLAMTVSWGSGEIVDWVQLKIEGPQATAQNPGDVTQLLKLLGQSPP